QCDPAGEPGGLLSLPAFGELAGASRPAVGSEAQSERHQTIDGSEAADGWCVRRLIMRGKDEASPGQHLRPVPDVRSRCCYIPPNNPAFERKSFMRPSSFFIASTGRRAGSQSARPRRRVKET